MFSRIFKKSRDTEQPSETLQITPGFENLALYYRNSCPFCLYVLGCMRAHKIVLELKNTAEEEANLQALVQGGGKSQVPCLRIEEKGKVKWLYESSDIVEYLEKKLGH